ncbi:MAG: transcriptional regulator GcvA [Erythrobacter sp.]
MQKLPPLNALRSFEAAARLGSFKLAAEELAVSQSAISHQIKLLEEVLGLDLFVRRPRKVELTEAGESYRDSVSEAFEKLIEGTRALLKSENDTTLNIQTYSTLAVRWLVPKLSSFNRRHPELEVRLITSQWDVDFARQDVDLGIIIGRSDSKNLKYDYLFSPMLFPVCSPAFLAKGRPLSAPQDLAEQPILQVYPSADDWPTWLESSGVEGVDPNSGLSFDSYDHALKTAVRGIGVAMAMHPYVSEDLSAGLLINLFPDRAIAAPGDWNVVYPVSRNRVRKIRKFSKWLQEEIENDPELSPHRRI